MPRFRWPTFGRTVTADPGHGYTPGVRWDGPAARFSGPDVDHRAGIYALDPDGKDLRQPLVRLVAVDDAPGNVDDGAFHYEVAASTDGDNKTFDGSKWPYPGGGIVTLEPEQIVGRAQAAGGLGERRQALQNELSVGEINPVLRKRLIAALKQLEEEDTQ